MKVHFQKKKIACAIISILIGITVYIYFAVTAFKAVALVCGVCVSLIAFIVLYSISQGQFGVLSARGNLERAGLVNKKGEPPILLRQFTPRLRGCT